MPSAPATSSVGSMIFQQLELEDFTSFAEGTQEVADVALIYPEALKIVLGYAGWTFANRWVQIAETEIDDGQWSNPEMPFVYLVPVDCVKVREVYGLNVQWSRDDKYLRANQGGTIEIRYTKLIQNENLLPAEVKFSVALQAAFMLAPKYKVPRTKRNDLKENLNDVLAEAKRLDKQASAEQHDGQRFEGFWDVEAQR